MSSALWLQLFGNPQPVEIEIGPGRGDVLLAFAAARPDTNFFGIERVAPLAAGIEAIAAARGLANLRVVAGDARCIVAHLIPDASVQAYHVYFPDPWPKTRHRARRLFHGDTLARGIVRTLVHGGTVHLASDLPSLVSSMRAALEAQGMQPEPPAVPLGWPGSKYEQRYAREGTYRATLRRD